VLGNKPWGHIRMGIAQPAAGTSPISCPFGLDLGLVFFSTGGSCTVFKFKSIGRAARYIIHYMMTSIQLMTKVARSSTPAGAHAACGAFRPNGGQELVWGFRTRAVEFGDFKYVGDSLGSPLADTTSRGCLQRCQRRPLSRRLLVVNVTSTVATGQQSIS
jgi:hypothetical protein